MATGTPVVISNGVHIWQEIEQAEAGWITTCEIERLTTALTLALRSPEVRKQRGENARQLVQQQYSWSAIAKQTIAAYNSLIHQ